MSILEKLKDSKAIIVTHVFATGPAQELEEYLKNKTNTLMFIGHPFLYANDIRSFFRIYKSGKIVKEKKAIGWKLAEIFMYVKDIFYTIFWVLILGEEFDLYVGADNLNAFVGVLLRRIGRIKKVVFYTIDYHPQRFNNKILNWLYHRLDKFCIGNCDWVWNLSPLMAEARKKRGFKRNKVAPQLTVPIGVNFKRIKPLLNNTINRYRHTVVFMGHLKENQGVELIIKAFPDILKDIPTVKLIIIGTGSLDSQLRNKVSELRLNECVTFTGFIEDHQEVEKLLTSCAVGIAPYKPNPKSFTWYADPSKPKQYLACGLPVVITKVAWIAEEIEKRPLGIVINYNREELARAIIKLLKDDEFYEKCRKNAIEFASKLSWDKIFSEAFSKIEL